MDITQLTKVAPHVYQDVRGNVYADLPRLVKQLRQHHPRWQLRQLRGEVREQLRERFPGARIAYV